MPVRKIDKAALVRMWEAGVSSADIADSFGVQYPAINRAAKQLGLTRREQGGSRTRQVAQQPDIPAFDLEQHASSDAALAAAKTYGDLVKVADRFGMTLTQAQSRWHRVRT